MARFQEQREELREKWSRLAPRERKALKLLILFLALAVVFQLAWTAYTESRRVDRTLPQLQQQLLEMQQWASEAQTLSGRAAEKVWNAADVAARIDNVLKAGDNRVTGAQVMVDGEGRLHVSGTAAFAVWLDLVALLQNDFRYFPAIASVNAESPSLVRFDATFTTIKH